ncbi:hypothetical protein Rsub_10120 [Raphidocelis subcapitata]|uniref:CobW C-terminal domain-containing protein n=1 Tax=Raphidocelis subcapitata TaxID=307507 RepID=A0A2V0PC43_9CHLO|nr:hypothetical protein Rsub_10120 [Raphidocelis subcapitata]|eukprot:GBF97109.1 hypothetical protein Rsub_10120 [Raphidocelis subcapitata]
MAAPAPSRELGEAAVVLSARYEQRLLQPRGAAADGARVVPALVVTGFLGSGKTTLVQHLLDACSASLRIGVLVNEVAALDVDSAALNARQRNAAVGVRAAELSGGCACCTVSGAFGDALAALVASSAYQELDYLVVETSGAADAAALAATLAGGGFALDLVVCVVDAEAGAAALERHPIARAQLEASDVVVLNKVDLASMGAVCDLEDAVRALAPGARPLRCRFGQVEAGALLDLTGGGRGGQQGHAHPHHQQHQQQQAEEEGKRGREGQSSAVGEVGFLSHEGQVTQAVGPRGGGGGGAAAVARREGGWRHGARQGGERPVGDGGGDDSGHDHGRGVHSHGSHDHSSFATLSFQMADAPLCMACFQVWVSEQLLATPGLFRAKGSVWLRERRALRYAFHLSGRQRAECAAQGCWDGPAGTRLALIGQCRGTLEGLRDGLLSGCTAGACGCAEGGSSGSSGGSDGGSSGSPAAAEFARLAAAHPRFRVLEPDNGGRGGGEDGCVVEFSCQAAPLHGVEAEAVNAQVLRRVNAAAAGAAAAAPLAAPAAPAAPIQERPPFLCAVAGAAMLSAATGLASAERPIASLQAGFRPGAAAADGAAAWRALDAAAAPVLRRAYAHVTSCKCDVAEAMRLEGS